MWLVAQRNRQHLLRRSHLQIERQVDLAAQPIYVVVRDMPAILAQMGGDAIDTGVGSQPCSMNRVGMPSATGVPDRRHMVDVQA
jgi:hypothetical protein